MNQNGPLAELVAWDERCLAEPTDKLKLKSEKLSAFKVAWPPRAMKSDGSLKTGIDACTCILQDKKTKSQLKVDDLNHT